MNEKFFSLPREKQQRIINAGYHVFGHNSYKKSPVSEIANAAGISKSLLFHYFHNKKELYLYLWNHAAKFTTQVLHDYHCYEPADLFEMIRRGMCAKFHIMREYPDLAAFTLRAYCEENTEIYTQIHESYQQYLKDNACVFFPRINPEKFRPGLNLDMIRREMYWASTGYVWEALKKGPLDVDELERDFTELLEFWQKAYCRSETEAEK